MLERLQKKWKIGGRQMILVLCVFAITGTSTAYISRQITTWLNLPPSSGWYWSAKAAVLIFGYQFLILLISVPFGQFRFFWAFEKRMLQRIIRLFSRRRGTSG